MKFSLINVHQQNVDGSVDGSLIQHKIAPSLGEAVDFAKETNKVNSGKLVIAVVPELLGRTILDGFMTGLVPLAVVKGENCG